MSRRKQARPRLCKRDDDEDADPDDAPEAKIAKLSESNGDIPRVKETDDSADGPEPEMEIFRCETCSATFNNLLQFMDHRNLTCGAGSDRAEDIENGSRSETPTSLDSIGDGSGTPSPAEMSPDEVPFVSGADDSHPYACQFCDKAFERVSHLKVHEQIHPEQLPYRCTYCHHMFRYKRSRDRHLKLHTGVKKYKCRHCDATFARSDHLKSHLKTHTAEDSVTYTCSVCELGFSTEAALSSHMNKHKNEDANSKSATGLTEPHRCMECKQTFNTEKEIKSHRCDALAGIKTLTCPYCTAICVGQMALALHTEHAHSPDMVDQNKCPICYKCFLGLDELAAHMKVHDISIPSLNSETMSSSELASLDLAATILSNNSSKGLGMSGLGTSDVLVCPYCLRDDFDTLEGLEVHMQSVHSVKPTEVYTCNYCNAPYKNLYSLHEHMRAVHQNQPSMGIKYPCSRCGKEYPSIEALQDHKKRMHHFTKPKPGVGAIDSLLCVQCNIPFRNPATLHEHMIVFHCDKAKEEAKPKVAKPLPHVVGIKDGFVVAGDNHTIINVPEPSMVMRHLKSPPTRGQRSVSSVEKNTVSTGSTVHHTPRTPSIGETIKQEKLTCDQCNATFQEFISYQTHMKLHIDSVLGQFSCRQCNKLFLTEEQLECHISSHFLSVMSEFGCSACSKTFGKPDELQKHLMDIHAHHLYRCALCKEIFDSKVNIQVHFAIKHSNESKMYKCMKCDVIFPSETEWQVHVRVAHLHLTKPYRCLFCKDSFTSEMDLQCHLATHNKPFKCSMCDESFLVEFLLDKHIQNIHSSAPIGGGNMTSPRVRSGSSGGSEAGIHGGITVKLEADGDVNDVFTGGPVASLYGALYENGLGFTNVSPSSVGSLVWRSPDDIYRCNICDMKFSQLSSLQTHKTHDHGLKYSPVKLQYSPSISPQLATPPIIASERPTEKPGSIPKVTEDSATSTSAVSGSPSPLVSNDKYLPSVLTDALRSTMPLPLTVPEPRLAFSDKLASTFGEKLTLACSLCSQTFKCKSDMEKHSKIHLNTGSQKCNICDEVFASGGILAEHKLTHCKIQQGNVCVACKMQIRSEDQFYVHSQQHGFQGAVMQCIVCRQTLSSMVELQMHGRHHFQARATFYTCCVCLKTFDSSENLVSKLNSSGRTYYVCKPCYHGESSEFVCSQCNATFSSNVLLENHVLTHKRTYQCIKCQESFSSEEEIQIHVTTHVMTEGNLHECKLCFIVFDSPAKLQCHLIDHTYKHSEYRCSICGRTFETSADIQVHALEHGLSGRRYGCVKCSQKFFFSAELENHMYVHKNPSSQSDSAKSTSNQSLLSRALSSQQTDINQSKDKDSANQSMLRKSLDQSPAKHDSQSKYKKTSNKSVTLPSSSAAEDLKCSKCDKTFNNVINLSNHYKQHEGEKQLSVQCSHCQEKFSAIVLLQNHFFSTHANKDVDAEFKIDARQDNKDEPNVENKQRTNRINPRGAQLTTEPEETPTYPCPVCLMSFSKAAQVREHIKQHYMQTGSDDRSTVLEPDMEANSDTTDVNGTSSNASDGDDAAHDVITDAGMKEEVSSTMPDELENGS